MKNKCKKKLHCCEYENNFITLLSENDQLNI